MRRIIALSLILVTISGLAVAEVATDKGFKPEGYVLEIGPARFIVVTPLDRGRAVLITKEGSIDHYMVEGVLARAAAKAAELIAEKPSTDKDVGKFVREMVAARQVSLGGEKAVVTAARQAQKM